MWMAMWASLWKTVRYLFFQHVHQTTGLLSQGLDSCQGSTVHVDMRCSPALAVLLRLCFKKQQLKPAADLAADLKHHKHAANFQAAEAYLQVLLMREIFLEKCKSRE